MHHNRLVEARDIRHPCKQKSLRAFDQQRNTVGSNYLSRCGRYQREIAFRSSVTTGNLKRGRQNRTSHVSMKDQGIRTFRPMFVFFSPAFALNACLHHLWDNRWSLETICFRWPLRTLMLDILSSSNNTSDYMNNDHHQFFPSVRPWQCDWDANVTSRPKICVVGVDTRWLLKCTSTSNLMTVDMYMVNNEDPLNLFSLHSPVSMYTILNVQGSISMMSSEYHNNLNRWISMMCSLNDALYGEVDWPADALVSLVQRRDISNCSMDRHRQCCRWAWLDLLPIHHHRCNPLLRVIDGSRRGVMALTDENHAVDMYISVSMMMSSSSHDNDR